MNFLFSHDGHTFAKHSECHDGEPTQVLFDQADQAPVEEPQPIDPSGEAE